MAGLDRGQCLTGTKRHDALHDLAMQLDRASRTSSDALRVRTLASTVRDLASGARP